MISRYEMLDVLVGLGIQISSGQTEEDNASLYSQRLINADSLFSQIYYGREDSQFVDRIRSATVKVKMAEDEYLLNQSTQNHKLSFSVLKELIDIRDQMLKAGYTVQ